MFTSQGYQKKKRKRKELLQRNTGHPEETSRRLTARLASKTPVYIRITWESLKGMFLAFSHSLFNDKQMEWA